MTTIPTRKFPNTRMRRSRQYEWSRQLCAESRLAVQDLILPMFIIEDNHPERNIATMPGVHRQTIADATQTALKAQAAGIPAVALFPVVPVELKDAEGREAYNEENLVCRTVRAIKEACPNLGVITDIALDPYTDHGHDGILVDDQVDNDLSLKALCAQAECLLKAGTDVLAPSDMMDGRVGALRQLCERTGHKNTLILSYAAKYSSAFYSPFRDAIGSNRCLQGASKATYQQSPPNSDEALHEVALDLEEGADWVMVKPGMPYLDVLYRTKTTFGVPTFAYQISGEYAMLRALAGQDQAMFTRLMLEALTGFKRAGADGIFTYAALDIAHALEPH